MSKVTILLAVIGWLTTLTSGCFEWEDHVEYYNKWMQKTSMKTHDIWTIDTYNKQKEIIVTNDKERIIITCLKSYSDRRYKVMVFNENTNQKRYQCLQLKHLSKYVMRLAKTKSRKVKRKVKCETEKYIEDEAVIYAEKRLHLDDPQPCPLTGGYQIIFHQSEAISAACLDRIEDFNPRIQFECGVTGSGRVSIEFGRDCRPVSLERTKKMTETKAQCIGSWDESGYSSVLLRLDYNPDRSMCLHYKHSPIKAATVGEERMEVYVTFDGRCVTNAFGDKPSINTSTHGFLASYRPETDKKCTDKRYLGECQADEDDEDHDCYGTTECPSNCNRCIQHVDHKEYSFAPKAQGNWGLLNSHGNLEIKIGSYSLRSSAFGEFDCEGPSENSPEGTVYPVVQNGDKNTCMPYHVCALISPLTSGVLLFNLIPAMREESGEVMTCERSVRLQRETEPFNLLETKTLFDETQMQPTNCMNRLYTGKFPTTRDSGKCKIDVQTCKGGNCQVLSVDYDKSTCQLTKANPLNIDKEHTCYASFELAGGNAAGVITQGVNDHMYRCWIFSSTTLYLALPEYCNQKAVELMIKDGRGDPFQHLAGSIASVGAAGLSSKSSKKVDVPINPVLKSGNENEDDSFVDSSKDKEDITSTSPVIEIDNKDNASISLITEDDDDQSFSISPVPGNNTEDDAAAGRALDSRNNNGQIIVRSKTMDIILSLFWTLIGSFFFGNATVC